MLTGGRENVFLFSTFIENASNVQCFEFNPLFSPTENKGFVISVSWSIKDNLTKHTGSFARVMSIPGILAKCDLLNALIIWLTLICCVCYIVYLMPRSLFQFLFFAVDDFLESCERF